MVLFKNRSKMRIKFRPMTGAYLAIMLICIIVRFTPLTSGLVSVDDAINDFSVGAFASTWVAWLLDIATCRVKNKELKEKERIAFTVYVEHVFDLVISLSKIGSLLICTTKPHSVKDWLSVLADTQNYQNDNSEDERIKNYRQVIEMVKRIKVALQTLVNQHVMLVEANIVDTYDFHQHADFQIGLCDTIIECLEDNGFSDDAISQANELVDMLVDNCRTFIPDTIPTRFTWLDAKG